MAHTDFTQHHAPGQDDGWDRDLDEHLRTYALFRTWAMWGALGTPLLLAFVLYWTT